MKTLEHGLTDTAWPLMGNNISRDDLDSLIAFLSTAPRLTQSEKVADFERAWSTWLSTSYSVFVNSGASANFITMMALQILYPGGGEILVPTLTWVSDIASVLRCGFTPVFVDVDISTLGMDGAQAVSKLNKNTRAVFLTHILGYNALTPELLGALRARNVLLIEDVCESHGASYRGKKLGTLGVASNFSFYFAHHATTIEGGMISTDDAEIYQICRMLRSHGLVRESSSREVRDHYSTAFPDLSPDFIFAYPSYNAKNTEIGAVLGLSQLAILDERVQSRNRNLFQFLERLNPERFYTDFATDGCSNYAFTVVLRHPDRELMNRIMKTLTMNRIEYRRGLSGGGNQLRQPYLKGIVAPGEHRNYPVTEHLHFYSLYVGNYPELDADRIKWFAKLLNEV